MAKHDMRWKREIGPFHDGATRLEPGFSMGARISDKGEVLGNPRGVTQVLRMGECDVRFELHRRTPADTPMPEAQRDALRGVVTTMLAEGLKAAGDTSGIVVLPGTKVIADLVGGTGIAGEVVGYTPGTHVVIRCIPVGEADPKEWTIALDGCALLWDGNILRIEPSDDDGEVGECDGADDAWERAQETQHPDDDGVSGACWDEVDTLMYTEQEGASDASGERQPRNAIVQSEYVRHAQLAYSRRDLKDFTDAVRQMDDPVALGKLAVRVCNSGFLAREIAEFRPVVGGRFDALPYTDKVRLVTHPECRLALAWCVDSPSSRYNLLDHVLQDAYLRRFVEGAPDTVPVCDLVRTVKRIGNERELVLLAGREHHEEVFRVILDRMNDQIDLALLLTHGERFPVPHVANRLARVIAGDQHVTISHDVLTHLLDTLQDGDLMDGVFAVASDTSLRFVVEHAHHRRTATCAERVLEQRAKPANPK